ncbi:MAG: hypothetical protein PHI12_11365 [Dehalococcoidales bacterium]|nr:hypothetical protein [Dehalococcoidales bacterium]
MNKPVYALSAKNPWGWLECMNLKDTENRYWKFPMTIEAHRVELPIRIYIHAAVSREEMTADNKHWILSLLTVDQRFAFLAAWERMTFGAIIGEVTITGCQFRFGEENDNLYSKWHMAGQYGFKLKDGVLYDKPIPCRGRLNFFTPKLGVV